MYFKYGDKEIEYLKSKDKKLAEIIDKVGFIERPVESDLFSSVIRQIVGQQISTKAMETVWGRFVDLFDEVADSNGRMTQSQDENTDTSASKKTKDIERGNRLITAEGICNMSGERLQSVGLSFRKVEYIKDFAGKVHSGEFDIDALKDMSDEEAIEALSALKGIGVWTAEMLLLFCLQRPDILSYGDLAIRRGMRMVYRHRELDKKKFEKYRRRLSPYCSVASLYFWAVAGGAIPELTDPAPKKR